MPAASGSGAASIARKLLIAPLVLLLVAAGIVAAGCSDRHGSAEPAGAPVAASAGPASGHAHDHGHAHEAEPGHGHAHEGAAADDHASFHAGGPDASAPCTCDAARMANGWCVRHQVGYVAGLPVDSAMLFEAMDAHGHEIDPATLTCAGCRAAMSRDGFCEDCRWGFVDRKLYFSRLTWLVARGQRRAAGTVTCALCRSHLQDHGWCETCAVGTAGNVVFTDRPLYGQAVAELARLREAIALSGRCETCGVAFFMRSRCPACGISYRDGSIPRNLPGPSPLKSPAGALD